MTRPRKVLLLYYCPSFGKYSSLSSASSVVYDPQLDVYNKLALAVVDISIFTPLQDVQVQSWQATVFRYTIGRDAPVYLHPRSEE